MVTKPPAPRWTGWVLIVGGGAFAAFFSIVGVFGLVEVGAGGISMTLLAFFLMGLGFTWARAGCRVLWDRVRRPRSLQDHLRKPMKRATSDALMELPGLVEDDSDGDGEVDLDGDDGDDGESDDWGD